MSNRMRTIGPFWILAALLSWPLAANAQVPVDEDGKPVGQVEITPGAEIEEFNALSASELDELIGPIALYPDDLLAIILPASTYPLQIVQAARFLEDLEKDSSLKPDEDWDDSVVALTNYPEIVEMMSEDLDWTWRLGEAVVAQQTDVITAIEAFRDRAYAAGNLKSDDFQTVTEEDGSIQITPVQEDVIYVPYYEPEQVVIYQPRPVYYYYPRSYPVYYYPYPSGYSFAYDYFWGVTTAFSIGWHSHHLHTWHHSYYGHPYYGRHYWNNWWYRRPDIHVYNNYYVTNRHNVSHNRYSRGDYWQPNTRRTVRSSDQRLTRTRYYPNSRTQTASAAESRIRSASGSRPESVSNAHRNMSRSDEREPKADFEFRDREGTATTSRSSHTVKPSTVRQSSEPQRVNSRQSQRSNVRTTAPKQSAPRQSEPKPSYSRTSEPKPTYSQPSQPRQSSPRTSQPKQSYSRPSQPKQSYSRPSQPKQSYSRPSQPKQSYSRPSQPKQSYSRPSQPKQSSSASSKSRSSSSSSSRSSHRSSSRSSSGRKKD